MRGQNSPETKSKKNTVYSFADILRKYFEKITKTEQKNNIVVHMV